MATLSGKVALVTGGSRGIGRGIAERLARDGAAVAIGHSADGDASEVLAAIHAQGGRAVAIAADLARVDEVRRMFAQVDAAFGRLDILVNNAGLGSLGTLGEIAPEEFDRVFAVNARAVLFACQEAARRMVAGGRIVTVSSSILNFPTQGGAVYAASKAAAAALTPVLARELAPRGITVNSVAPGPTEPGMFSHAPDAMKQAALAASPAGRLGRPEDVAGLVAFLAGPEAEWITGQHILANGGSTV